MTHSRLKRIQLADIAKRAGETLPLSAPIANTDIKLMDLDCDLKTLKTMTLVSDKIAFKKDVLLPKWEKLALGNEVIFQHVTLWQADVADLSSFLKSVDHAIKQGIDTPEFIKRDWPTLACDTVHDWAEEQAKLGQSISPYFDRVFEKVTESNWIVHEKVQAKLYKLAGQQLLRDEDGKVQASKVGCVEQLEKALAFLSKAEQLNKKIGVGDLVKNRIPARINALSTGKNL